ncbi:MAG: ATP-binding protein [Deltaproteobacteria bacterium]|nr:ATP-binding protein [Deltaproteobacteria bacterium]MBI3390993.1 ATP-binding protein [Deltaproteobacteria bacterium]
MNSTVLFNPRGSEWHRWDPHIHAPGTLLVDAFHEDWEKYLGEIETSVPTVRALGVTDYFCINAYHEVRKRKAQGRLANVELLFPNVEMRLDIKTEKKHPINLHLLFSPDDPDHESEIQRILGQLQFHFEPEDRTYHCTLDDFERLGRAIDATQTDRQGAIKTGANQFKATFDQLRELFRREGWLRKNCLVAVAGGSNDGTAGLQSDDSYKASRWNLESFAHIIFAGTPAQRDFWLGKTPQCPPGVIEKHYRSLKPCLHGSDAHRHEKVLTPDLKRYCWLKGDLTFETLRQAVIEPEERAWIGEAPPPETSPAFRIDRVTVSDATWFTNGTVEMNGGLVAIIGERGSGKTALADIVAQGTRSLGGALAESSFLRRATHPENLVGSARVELRWGDGAKHSAELQPQSNGGVDDEAADARYLSQQFVEQLCSSAGLATQLRDEIERVIFEATDDADRLGAASFDELKDARLEAIRRRRDELRELILSASDTIAREDILRDGLDAKRKTRKGIAEAIEKAKKELLTLIPKGKEERARQLAAIDKACSEAEGELQRLQLQRQRRGELQQEREHILNQIEPRRFAEMQRTFAAAALSEEEWKAFRMQFAGDADGVIRNAIKDTDGATKTLLDGDPSVLVDEVTTPLLKWPLALLRRRRDETRKDVGVDVTKQRKFDEVKRTIAQQEARLGSIDREIKHAEGAEGRRRECLAQRRDSYLAVFGGLLEEQEVLEELYGPLRKKLARAEGALAKLDFFVHRLVDMGSWVEAGERLLDLRTAGRFRGRGNLREIAERELLAAWRDGSAETVATAMDVFRKTYHSDLLEGRPSTVKAEDRHAWVQSLGAWLYSTDHVTLEYGIRYDGVPIERLSPGTRGIVLLLLYLAIDDQDRRPLIIDQPEENLDPKSVFDELVFYFRAARKRRQVIVVTHNANLVVNTDADQVIVAESIRGPSGGLPSITYRSGSLENREIRKAVCELLEGGERAFLERERRYRLRWDELIGTDDPESGQAMGGAGGAAAPDAHRI